MLTSTLPAELRAQALPGPELMVSLDRSPGWCVTSELPVRWLGMDWKFRLMRSSGQLTHGRLYPADPYSLNRANLYVAPTVFIPFVRDTAANGQAYWHVNPSPYAEQCFRSHKQGLSGVVKEAPALWDWILNRFMAPEQLAPALQQLALDLGTAVEERVGPMTGSTYKAHRELLPPAMQPTDVVGSDLEFLQKVDPTLTRTERYYMSTFKVGSLEFLLTFTLTPSTYLEQFSCALTLPQFGNQNPYFKIHVKGDSSSLRLTALDGWEETLRGALGLDALQSLLVKVALDEYLESIFQQYNELWTQTKDMSLGSYSNYLANRNKEAA